MIPNDRTLGPFLKVSREAKRLSLRDVERSVAVSNAYLSQLESGRIKEPSPKVLHKLAELYEIAYDDAMELAGYPTSKPGASRTDATALGRLGPVTSDEANQLAEYLSFLRQRKRRTDELR